MSRKRSAKEIIVDVLSCAGPLSAKQIHNRLLREHALSNTYQATHKSLCQMLEDKTLLKSKANYSINPEWVENNRKQAEELAEKVKNKDLSFDIAGMVDGQSVQISFQSIPEVAWFLIDKFFNAPNPGKKPCLALWRFCYSVLGLEARHIEGLKVVFAKNEWHAMVEEKNAVDKMFGETLQSYGLKEIKYGIKCAAPLSDKMVVGDYIAEVIYPSLLRKGWGLQNRLPKRIVQFNLANHLLGMREMRMKIDVVIVRNAKLADEYRKEYLG